MDECGQKKEKEKKTKNLYLSKYIEKQHIYLNQIAAAAEWVKYGDP